MARSAWPCSRSLRSSVQLHEPDRPSPWSIPYSGGKYRNVGVGHRDVEPPAPLPTDQRSRSWAEDDDDAPPRTPMSLKERKEVRARLITPPPHMQKSASLKSLARAHSAPGLPERRAWH